MLSCPWQMSSSWWNAGSPAARDQGSSQPALTTPEAKPPSTGLTLIKAEGFGGWIGVVLLQARGMSTCGLGLHPTTPQLQGMLWVGGQGSTECWWLNKYGGTQQPGQGRDGSG